MSVYLKEALTRLYCVSSICKVRKKHKMLSERFGKFFYTLLADNFFKFFNTHIFITKLSMQHFMTI